MIPCACLNPKKVFNKTLGHWITVPCGHCDACLCSKGFNLSSRLSESVSMYSHKYFVTLTFSDDYLPVARYNETLDSFVHPFDCDYNGEVYSVPSSIVRKSLCDKYFRQSFLKYNGIPVLSHRLAINFKKRLRKKFSKLYGKEYLFIYIVGEYGETFLRPHYHAILCTNAPVQSCILEKCVFEAWSYYDKVRQEYISSYGRIDFQRIVSNGANCYVAQYLSASTQLPAVYSSGLFRPFYQSSPLVISDYARFSDRCLKDLFFECSPQETSFSLRNNEVFADVLPNSIINRIFPKCFKFSSIPFGRRVQFYSMFERQPFTSAEKFADNVISGFFFSGSNLGVGDDFGIIRQYFVDSDLYSSRLRLIKAFYLSRRVCLNAHAFGVSVVEYVRQIDLFWSRFELLKLRKFYELQESLLTDKYNPCTVSDIFSLYFDTTDDLKNLFYYYDLFKINFDYTFVSVNNISKQVSYSNLMHKILSDTTKTKKRNDYFEKNGLKKPSFLFKYNIKKSCQKFFQI